MRIVAWNCRQAFGKKRAVLDALGADIAVISECGQRDLDVPSGVWEGLSPHKGLGVCARVPDRSTRA